MWNAIFTQSSLPSLYMDYFFYFILNQAEIKGKTMVSIEKGEGGVVGKWYVTLYSVDKGLCMYWVLKYQVPWTALDS